MYFAESFEPRSIPLTFSHRDETKDFTAITANIMNLQWDFVSINERQYIYLLSTLVLAGYSRKVKHHLMRRYLRKARVMKSRLPIEARRYV